jgi:hypothetical protein
VLLDLTRIDRLTVGIDAGSDDIRTLIHVGEKESWRNCWTVMETGTTVAVTAGTDLEVKWTVNSVFLCAEY